MKVLHISTYDSGGAGLCALRIHKAVLEKGVDSKMLVANKSGDNPFVFQAERSGLNAYNPPRNKLVRKFEKLLRRRGFFLTELERHQYLAKCLEGKAFYTFPLSNFDLASHPLVVEADVIHLHWIANCVDYPTFFSQVDKPIVWTLHDENIGLGGFHYQRDREKFYNICFSIEDELCRIKQKALFQNEGKIHFVAISNVMKQFCQNSYVTSKMPLTLIHNGIEGELFCPISKDVARQVLHVPFGNVVFAFCAQSLSDERKGLKELIFALDQLKKDVNVTLICAGGGELPVTTDVNVIKLGMIQNERLLSLFYSAADYFIMPSFQEAFAQTPLEAMACGTPVVSFPCSGSGDLITNQNGVVCDDFTVDELIIGIRKAMSNCYDRNLIREDVINRFSYKKIADDYIGLYNDVMHHHG